MTVAGGPSQPTVLLADAAAIAAGATNNYELNLLGRRLAAVSVLVNQTYDVVLHGALADGSFGALYDGLTKLELLAVSAVQRVLLVDVSALSWLRIAVKNTSASAGTVTVRVALS